MIEAEKVRVWLDDVRPMPEGFDIHCKTVAEASRLVLAGQVTHLSFDNDLGEKELEGYKLADMIEYLAHRGEVPPMTWAVHSSNSARRPHIEQAMRNAERYWGKE